MNSLCIDPVSQEKDTGLEELTLGFLDVHAMLVQMLPLAELGALHLFCLSPKYHQCNRLHHPDPVSMVHWNIAGADAIPKGSLVYLYNPLWVLIVRNF